VNYTSLFLKSFLFLGKPPNGGGRKETTVKKKEKRRLHDRRLSCSRGAPIGLTGGFAETGEEEVEKKVGNPPLLKENTSKAEKGEKLDIKDGVAVQTIRKSSTECRHKQRPSIGNYPPPRKLDSWVTGI